MCSGLSPLSDHLYLITSEAAVEETSPNRPIIVSAYRSLQAFVSAVKQGCSQVDDVTGGMGMSLRLVSFLEDTRRETWSKMKAILFTYVAMLFVAYFL